jgi:mRNA interferase MazF
MTPERSLVAWVPDRGDVIWIDHNPQAGREMKDHHPFVVLSTAAFHRTVGLVVGCAMTSAAYNRGSSLAVDLGPIPQRPDAHSYVLCHQIKSFDWKARSARGRSWASCRSRRAIQPSTLTTGSAHGDSRGPLRSAEPRSASRGSAVIGDHQGLAACPTGPSWSS